MSSRTPKSSKGTAVVSQAPQPKMSAVAVASAMAAGPAFSPEPSAEEFKEQVGIALAVQGGPKINHLWDELNTLHDDTVASISSVGQEIAGQLVAFTHDDERVAALQPWQKTRLNKLITQFHMDTDQHFSDLGQIKELHKDHSGGVENENDFMQVISLQGDYAMRQEIHQTLTMPQVTEMLEYTGAVALDPPKQADGAAANDDSNNAGSQAAQA